jgi:hypothetical protein
MWWPAIFEIDTALGSAGERMRDAADTRCATDQNHRLRGRIRRLFYTRIRSTPYGDNSGHKRVRTLGAGYFIVVFPEVILHNRQEPQFGV